MSILNKQNIKARAIEVAQHYAPHKVRYSPRFTQQLEKVVDAALIQMVKDQQLDKRQGLYDCPWAQNQIDRAKRVHEIYQTED
jgi:hypothetical protein